MCKYSIENKEICKYIVSLSTCAHKAHVRKMNLHTDIEFLGKKIVLEKNVDVDEQKWKHLAFNHYRYD